MPAGKATTSGGATTNIPTGTEDPLPPPPPLAQRQEECQQQPSTQQQPGHKKQASIVTMQSDGGTKVTLTRYRATMLAVRIFNETNFRDSTENVAPPPTTDPVVEENLECSCDLEEAIASTKPEDEHWVGQWMQITDCEQVFKCLNEPLKSTGEPLVVWPDERIRQVEHNYSRLSPR